MGVISLKLGAPCQHSHQCGCVCIVQMMHGAISTAVTLLGEQEQMSSDMRYTSASFHLSL